MIRTYPCVGGCSSPVRLSAKWDRCTQPCSYRRPHAAYQWFREDRQTAQLPLEQRAADFRANVAADIRIYLCAEVFGDDNEACERAPFAFSTRRIDRPHSRERTLDGGPSRGIGPVDRPQFFLLLSPLFSFLPLAQQQTRLKKNIHVFFADFQVCGAARGVRRLTAEV